MRRKFWFGAILVLVLVGAGSMWGCKSKEDVVLEEKTEEWSKEYASRIYYELGLREE